MFNFIRKIHQYINTFRKINSTGGIVNLHITQSAPSEELKGKVAVVTGGGKGLGLSITKALLDAGATVIMTGRDEGALIQAKKKFGKNVHYLLWDVTDFDNYEDLFCKMLLIVDKIDIWVNNAAYVYIQKNGTEADVEKFDRTMNTNVKAVYLLSIMIAEYYKKNKICGKIINISSINGIENWVSPYNLSKWAGNCITGGLAKKYAPFGIVTNAVAPGYIPSGINETDIYDNAYDEKSLTKRMVTLEEISEIVRFLASNKANSILGQTIVCDGGVTLR